MSFAADVQLSWKYSAVDRVHDVVRRVAERDSCTSVGCGYVLGSLKSAGSRRNVYVPVRAGSGNAPQKFGRKNWNPAFMLCSPLPVGHEVGRATD